MKTRTFLVDSERVASSVGASTEFEGMKPSAYAKEIGDRYLAGKISGNDAREKIKAKHVSKFWK